MTHSKSVQFQQNQTFGFKSLIAIKNFFALLASAFSEAKLMEEKSRKTSGNW
jgi:hypothetical protein